MNILNILNHPKLLPLLIMGLRAGSLVIKFALTLFIAKFMDFSVLGIYGLLAAISIMAPYILGLAIINNQTRQAVTQGKEQIVSTLKYYARFIGYIYSVLLVGALGYGVFTHQILMVLVVFLVIFFEHINNDLYYLMLNLSKQLLGNILHFIRSGLWMAIFMLVAFFMPSYRTLEFLLLCWFVGSALSLVGFFYFTRQWPWKTTHITMSLIPWVKTEFSMSRVMYLNNVAGTLSHYVSHFLILFFLGLELTGVYVFFMQIFSAMSNLLQTGVGQVARPKLVRAFKEKSETFKGIYKKCIRDTLVLATLMAITAVPAMYFLVHYIVDKPLALEWFPVFIPMMLAFVICMAALANEMVFYSHFRDDLVLKQNLLNIFLGLALNAILIPWLQLWGAAIGAMIIFTSVIIFQNYLFRRLEK